VHQTPAELAVALLVVYASGTVNATLGADEIGSAKARSKLDVYYSVHDHANLQFATMLRRVCCRMAVKAKVMVLMDGV
jgi:hypothetical protein